MKVDQSILNKLYSCEVVSVDFNFKRNTITFQLSVTETGKSKKYELFFREVERYKVNKEWADEDWGAISVAEIFYLPDLKKEYSINDNEKKNYDYLLDGDGFEILIKSSSVILNEL
jgi:hypothetical protein